MVSMNPSAPESSNRSGLHRWLTFEPAFLRGLSWRRIGYTFLAVFAFALWSASANWILMRFGSRHLPVGLIDFGSLMAHAGSSFLLILFPQMLALSVADNVRAAGAARFAALTAA